MEVRIVNGEVRMMEDLMLFMDDRDEYYPKTRTTKVSPNTA